MEYRKVVAVTGLGGLFELISSKADGGVVRSLEDNGSRFVSNRVHSFSHLESIEIYTTGDNVNLVEVFDAMTASKEKAPDANDAKAVKEYFGKVYPSMDFERVYNSDMKKMVKWHAILTKAGVEIKLSEPEAEESVQEEKADVEVKAEKKVAEKSEKKPTEKKAAKPAAAKKPAATAKAAPPKKITGPRKMS